MAGRLDFEKFRLREIQLYKVSNSIHSTATGSNQALPTTGGQDSGRTTLETEVVGGGPLMATFFEGFAAPSPALFLFLLLASDIVNWPVDDRAGLRCCQGLGGMSPKFFGSAQSCSCRKPFSRLFSGGGESRAPTTTLGTCTLGKLRRDVTICR